MAQKPFIVWSWGPKVVKYESLEPKELMIELSSDSWRFHVPL